MMWPRHLERTLWGEEQQVYDNTSLETVSAGTGASTQGSAGKAARVVDSVALQFAKWPHHEQGNIY